MAFSVVIPSNVGQKLRRCVFAILKSHPDLDPRKIIVVNDGAKDDWTDADPKVTWIEGVKPFIYARNVNIGIVSCFDDVVILGDDVLVDTPNAFALLAETALRPNAFAVSPAVEGPIGNMEQVPRFALSEFKVRAVLKPLCFVCVDLPRHAIDAVGLLDEQFVHYGCEDVDWCIRALDEGGKFFVDQRVTVRHNDEHMESAFRSKPDVGEQSDKARALLKAKWPGRVA